MKKIVKLAPTILLILAVNLILGSSISSNFNQGNLDLTSLNYFGGFNMLNLLPNNLIDLISLTISTLAIIAFNITALFQFKNLAN